MLQTLDNSKTVGQEQAYVMISCDDGGQGDVAEKMKSMEGITEITSTTGSYDIVAKLVVPSLEALRETIILKIRRLPKVRATTTIVCLSSQSYAAM